MDINRIKNLEDAWGIAQPWRSLSHENPMLSPDWLLSWWKYFGNQSELFLLETKNTAGMSVGIAPFFACKKLASYQLQAFGTSNVCTDYVKLISSQEDATEVTHTVCDYLASHFGRQSAIQMGELAIEGIESGAPWVAVFRNAMQEHGFHCWETPLESSFRIQLPATWQEYVAGLSSSLKRKAKKMLARLESGEISFFSESQPDKIFQRLPDLQKAHQNRRNSLGQPGCYADPRFGPFLREATMLLAEHNQIRVEWCEKDHQVIAMHLVLVGRDTSFIYQAGIDPNFIAVEPGHALTVAAIRRAIQDGNRFYDLLRGEEPYKKYWGGQAVSLSTLRCRPPQVASRVAGFTQQSLWQMKQSIKSVVGAAKGLSLARNLSKAKSNG